MTCQALVYPRGLNLARGLPCGNRATRDGYCRVHHPDAVAARRAANDRIAEAKLARKQAAWDRLRTQAADAERFAWLDEHWSARIDGQSLFRWLDDKRLRAGGLAAAIDAARDWFQKGLR